MQNVSLIKVKLKKAKLVHKTKASDKNSGHKKSNKKKPQKGLFDGYRPSIFRI